MESYFRRCASVFVSVRSLAATNSILELPRPARTTFLPIRPKPFIPTLIAICLYSTGFSAWFRPYRSVRGVTNPPRRRASLGGRPSACDGLSARLWTLDILLKCRLWCEPLACRRWVSPPTALNPAVHYGGQGLALRRALESPPLTTMPSRSCPSATTRRCA